MEAIQELKQVNFRRTVIPPDAANTNIHLLVFTDESQNLGVIATVFSAGFSGNVGGFLANC
jgi:hypothetical protein